MHKIITKQQNAKWKYRHSWIKSAWMDDLKKCKNGWVSNCLLDIIKQACQNFISFYWKKSKILLIKKKIVVFFLGNN